VDQVNSGLLHNCFPVKSARNSLEYLAQLAPKGLDKFLSSPHHGFEATECAIKPGSGPGHPPWRDKKNRYRGALSAVSTDALLGAPGFM
jgi:hypothetical protein